MSSRVDPGSWRRVDKPRKRDKRPPQAGPQRPRVNPRAWDVVTTRSNGRPLYLNRYYNNSLNSPRVNGKLVLRDNAHTFNKSDNISFIVLPNSRGEMNTVHDTFWPNVVPPTSVTNPLYNKAYARLRGKLYKDSASLGVTFGSWAQSAEMISKRLDTVRSLLDLTIRKYTSNRSFRERQKKLFKADRVSGRETAANVVLEANFGWAPLFQDIHNSFVQLVGDPPTKRFVKGKAVGQVDTVRKVDDAYHHPFIERIVGPARVTMSATVTVSNPNIWMLNKLGLINPVSVAWDLVPWSFVVNMFGNVNQLINSLTDFIGLSFGSVNVTTSAQLMQTVTDRYGSANDPCEVVRIDLTKFRSRSFHSQPPRPTFQFRCPDFNKDLLIIGGALVIQRFNKLNRLLGFPPL